MNRIYDIISSIFLLIVLSPLFLIISILIKIESKGPVIFKQKRFGIRKKHFYIFKFRTMHVYAPANVPTHLFNNSKDYVTRLGLFLRKYSLDELPQLINILKGDITYVGPRPALFNQFDLINERDKYGANNIKPGVTGLAQILGRDYLTIEHKARLDGFYFTKKSFLLNVHIMLITIKIVISASFVKV